MDPSCFEKTQNLNTSNFQSCSAYRNNNVLSKVTKRKTGRSKVRLYSSDSFATWGTLPRRPGARLCKKAHFQKSVQFENSNPELGKLWVWGSLSNFSGTSNAKNIEFQAPRGSAKYVNFARLRDPEPAILRVSSKFAKVVPQKRDPKRGKYRVCGSG